MTVSLMDELVSQADAEGVTLTEVIARRMSAVEMESAQRTIADELAENYTRIAPFMKDVEVSSMTDMATMSVNELMGLRDEMRACLSDTAAEA